MASLTVAGEDVIANIGQHRRRHLAGERSGLLRMAVLRADSDMQVGDDVADWDDPGERWEDRNFDVRRRLGRPGKRACQRDGFAAVEVHLPVASDQLATAHGRSPSRAATPGSV